jgi:L-fuculose-phosphate aldolase
MNNYKKERKQVASFIKRLYKQGLTTSLGGNISVRISNDTILITPSSTDKGKTNWKEIAIISLFGENLTQELIPSIETGMHLSIYKKKKDITAIIHAHPLFSSAFTAMKLDINTCLTAEASSVLGKPIKIPYALMGSNELAETVAENIQQSDILLLENHGIISAGSSLLDTFNKIEVLENAAKMTMIVEMTKKKSPLSKSKILEIERLFR